MEIIAATRGVGKNSKKIQTEYFSMIKNYSEFEILIDLSEQELKKIAANEIVQSIVKVRNKNIKVIPGYDGIYGTIDIPKPPSPKQVNLI